jgi:hypothetical protein
VRRFQTLIIVVIVIAAGVALSRTDAGQLILGRWSFTKSLVVNDGYYFRLKVKLAYKGEPQDFDIVVGCTVRITTYKDNSNTYEAGLVPTVFGRRMSDGVGLVVRPPDACPGQTTANAKVPKEFIPLIIVYDDATTLAFGTAYMTEDAYHNPLSVLTFGQATIETATRADFDAFRARETNIVKQQMYLPFNELKARGLERPSAMFGRSCSGYARFRLFGEARAIAQRLWPADRPQYWSPPNEGEMELRQAWHSGMLLSDRDGATPQSDDDLLSSIEEPPDKGIVTLSGRHPLFSPATIPATVYPDISGWIRLPWPSDPATAALQIQEQGPRIGASIDYRNGTTLGFAYCFEEPIWYPANRTAKGLPSRQHYRSLPGSDLVDGVEVQQEWDGRASAIIERDEFLFTPVSFGIESTRGDV